MTDFVIYGDVAGCLQVVIVVYIHLDLVQSILVLLRQYSPQSEVGSSVISCTQVHPNIPNHSTAGGQMVSRWKASHGSTPRFPTRTLTTCGTPCW